MWALAIKTAVVVLAVIVTLVLLLLAALLFSLAVQALKSWADHRREQREWEADQADQAIEKKRAELKAAQDADRKANPCDGTFRNPFDIIVNNPCERRKGHPGEHGRYRE